MLFLLWVSEQYFGQRANPSVLLGEIRRGGLLCFLLMPEIIQKLHTGVKRPPDIKINSEIKSVFSQLVN